MRATLFFPLSTFLLFSGCSAEPKLQDPQQVATNEIAVADDGLPASGDDTAESEVQLQSPVGLD